MEKLKVLIKILNFGIGGFVIFGLISCGVANIVMPISNPPSESNPLPASPVGAGEVALEIPSARYEKLSESSFFKITNSVEYSNFKEYSPQFPLYSDGATKRRWIYLPPGTQINTVDPDEWIFPRGTILYKEFSVEGKKIETRVFEKTEAHVGASAWRSSVYVWLLDQSDAILLKANDFYTQPESELQLYQANQISNQYRMASMNQCESCHGSAKDVGRGFSYLQLSDETAALNILTLSKESFFSSSFSKVDIIPGSAFDRAAIGYLQSNCATCHDGRGPAPHNFKHKSTSLSLRDEPLIQSISNSPGLVAFGNLEGSRIFIRMNNGSMPKIPLFAKDRLGLNIVSDWIKNSGNNN